MAVNDFKRPSELVYKVAMNQVLVEWLYLPQRYYSLTSGVEIDRRLPLCGDVARQQQYPSESLTVSLGLEIMHSGEPEALIEIVGHAPVGLGAARTDSEGSDVDVSTVAPATESRGTSSTQGDTATMEARLHRLVNVCGRARPDAQLWLINFDWLSEHTGADCKTPLLSASAWQSVHRMNVVLHDGGDSVHSVTYWAAGTWGPGVDWITDPEPESDVY